MWLIILKNFGDENFVSQARERWEIFMFFSLKNFEIYATVIFYLNNSGVCGADRRKIFKFDTSCNFKPIFSSFRRRHDSSSTR